MREQKLTPEQMRRKRTLIAKRKRNRRLRRISFSVSLLLFLLIGIETVGKLGHGVGGEKVNITTSQEEETMAELSYQSPYGVVVPKQFTQEEMEDRLAALAAEYDEFAEIYDNRSQYSQKLLMALCNNPEMVDFVKGYPKADGTVWEELTDGELRQKMPLLIQWDERWGYMPYGDSVMGLAGCAPTCLSMVVIALTGDVSATPAAVAQFAETNDYYLKGTGTKWSLMSEGCLHFGICSRQDAPARDLIERELAAGNPIICSVREGDFTAGGHFIVLSGLSEGKIQVHDPNSRERSSRLWEYDTLAEQIKNMWIFYPISESIP